MNNIYIFNIVYIFYIKKMASETTKKVVIDHLPDDICSNNPTLKQNQTWIVVSFMSPEGVKNTKIRGFKFRGAFPTHEQASRHAEYIKNNEVDGQWFNVCVGEGFKWMQFDPKDNDALTIKYNNEELNNLAEAHKKQREKDQQFFNDRKESAATYVGQNQNDRKDKIIEKMKLKLAKKRGETIAANPEELDKKADDIKEKINKLEMKENEQKQEKKKKKKNKNKTATSQNETTQNSNIDSILEQIAKENKESNEMKMINNFLE